MRHDLSTFLEKKEAGAEASVDAAVATDLSELDNFSSLKRAKNSTKFFYLLLTGFGKDR